MEEAPSRRTSIWSRPWVGSWLTLTEKASAPASGEVAGCGARRRPLRRTRVLPEPMPRRLTLALSPRELAPPEVDSLRGTLVTCGSAVRSSTGVMALRTSMASRLKMVTGRTFSMSRRLRLEPVTATASSFTMVSSSFGSAAAGAVTDCAWSGRVNKSAASAVSRPRRPERRTDCMGVVFMVVTGAR